MHFNSHLLLALIIAAFQSPLFPMHLNKLVKNGDIEAVKIALFQNKRNPNKRDKHKNTPLIGATKKNTKQIAFLLIEAGARSNEQGDKGETALHWAAFLNHRAIAQYLIEKGAVLFLQNAVGDTPFMDAAQQKNRSLIEMMLKKSYFPPREHLAQFFLEEEAPISKLSLVTLQKIGQHPYWLLRCNLEIPEPLPERCFEAIAHESNLSVQCTWVQELHAQTTHNSSCICLKLVEALCKRHIKYLKKTLEVKNIFQKTAYDIARENGDEVTAALLNPETLEEKLKEEIKKIYMLRLKIEEEQGPA